MIHSRKGVSIEISKNRKKNRWYYDTLPQGSEYWNEKNLTYNRLTRIHSRKGVSIEMSFRTSNRKPARYTPAREWVLKLKSLTISEPNCLIHSRKGVSIEIPAASAKNWWIWCTPAREWVLKSEADPRGPCYIPMHSRKGVSIEIP